MTDWPRMPKLRASCDGCGAAKLRCDRAHPKCGRCQSLGLVCYYGVSRRCGKPPRSRPADRQPERPKERLVEKPADRLTMDLSSSGTTPQTLADASDHRTTSTAALDNLFMGMDLPDLNLNASTSLFGPSLATYMPLDPTDFMIPNTSNETTTSLFTPISTPITSPAEIAVSKTPPGLSGASTTAPSNYDPLVGNIGHDCPRDAYAVLGSVSFLDTHRTQLAQSTSASASPGTAASTGAANRVSLDSVLLISQEACDRLTCLLTCPCARSPHLALLYASIISRILIWYQQAAGCTESTSWSPAAAAVDAALRSVPTPPASTTSSTLSSTGGPTLAQATGFAVAPTQMSVGSLNIEDEKVKTALKIHLLSSEMRRVGAVIDLFGSRCSGGADSSTRKHAFDGVDDLYKSLSSWLRDEHARIVEVMKNKLTKLTDMSQK